MVGAVVVRDDAVIGEGFHAEYGGPHAEVVALRAAGADTRGATVYVTLEPCAHHGKTSPCADALIAAGVSRVVVAVSDPNPQARGGAEKLRDAGIDVIVGVEREAACELNAPFFNAFRSARPWIVVKLALSSEGAIADRSRSRRWLTGPESRAEVHRLRAGFDAVAVGLGTVLADDPELTARGVPQPRIQPARVVFDDNARLPLDCALVRTARQSRTIAVVRDTDGDRVAALAAHGVEILGAPSLKSGLAKLAHLGLRSILVEGGAGLTGRLLQDGFVDRMIIFRAPVTLGDGALTAFAHAPGWSLADSERFRIIESATFGPDTMTTYALTPAPCSPG
jgi:diaminohydroxyphosphoribosylaminopyrimidine deaminase/5-amino-6-(5-phosphoribosylamino)uracil reductase